MKELLVELAFAVTVFGLLASGVQSQSTPATTILTQDAAAIGVVPAMSEPPSTADETMPGLVVPAPRLNRI